MAGKQQPIAPATQAVERFFQLSLLGMLASGYCAVLGSNALDWPSALFGALALIMRGLTTAGVVHLAIPSRWVTVATVAYVVFYPIDYYYVSGTFLTATIHLVFFVAIVKLLTASTPRDYLLLELIAFLELLAASIISNNANFFIWLVLFLFFTISTFTSSEIRRASAGKWVVTKGPAKLERRLGWLAVSTGMGILLITAGLFFVLPRTARAALERFAGMSHRVSGYSNEVTLGQTGEIRQQGGAVLHVKFADGTVPTGMKWRGNALAEFDGWKWFNTAQAPHVIKSDGGLIKLVDDEQRRRSGRRIFYEVWMHGLGSNTLFVAGMPELFRLPAQHLAESKTGAYRVPLADGDQFRYVVYSYLDGPATGQNAWAVKLSEMDRHYYLRLPPFDPRVLRLAQQITEGHKSSFAKARAIEQYLRTNYSYSLEPLKQQPDDPLAYFLLERRKGHCEYFASAMAVMLRAVWIPSRVATGFQSGEYNPLSGWQVIRASNAHAWVEAFVPGYGWTTFDPTPSDPSARPASAWSKFGLWLDAADMFWQEWVLGYDIDRQMKLAFEVDRSRRRFSVSALEDWAKSAGAWMRSTGERTKDSASSIVLTVAIIVVLALILRAANAMVRDRSRLVRAKRGEMQSGDAARLYGRMLDLLRKHGHVRSPSQTPMEFARSLSEPETAMTVEAFTTAYHDARYGNRSDAAARMASLLDAIERLPRVAR